MKKLWQWFVRHAFRGLIRVLKRRSWKTATAWGTAFGSLGYALSARYRRVADKNLRLAYGDSLDEASRRGLIKRVFQNFGCALFEFLKAPSLSEEEVRRMVPIENYDFATPLFAHGKGLIMIGAHIGNWEMMARRCALDGYRFAVVARPSPDPGMNEITDYIRQSGGYEVYPRGNSAKTILQRLRNGGIIGILPDQKSEDVFVPFFGRPTGTVAGPAALALKTGAPILAMFCLRIPGGTYKVEIGSPIDITSTGDLQADKIRIMTDINAEIERVIRKYPDQWLWMHDRWKAPIPEDILRASEDASALTAARER